MKRSKHSLSHYRLATFDMGELVPVAAYEVLPGDTVQQVSSALLRVSPLVSPVMHPVTVRIHHWFVPNRLLWAGWEEFVTGGPDGQGGSSGAFPTITVNTGTGFALGSLADYLGVPTEVDDLVVSALPFRAYGLIFNEYYRDQDLVTSLVVSTGSGADVTTNLLLQKCAWEKDYFTSARPWPQKGPDVTLPLGDEAPLVFPSGISANVSALAKVSDGSSLGDLAVGQLASAEPSRLLATAAAAGAGSDLARLQGNTAAPTDAFADLSAATAVNVTDVRRAFALQRYEEARAAYGSRYTEYLRYLGVRSSDARLQRPEYLGGGKQTIAFSEVLQTGVTTDGDDTKGVGNLKGHGIAAIRTRRYRRFFEEHGYVLSLMSVRPRAMYLNGLHRSFLRRTKEDYWQKELEQIGQQEVFKSEVFAVPPGSDGVFGYQDRYAEYRHLPSGVSGDFRETLDFWHLARSFALAPALNADFVTCDPSKRIYAVQSEDAMWCMVAHSIQSRRMVRGVSAVGRII